MTVLKPATRTSLVRATLAVVAVMTLAVTQSAAQRTAQHASETPSAIAVAFGAQPSVRTDSADAVAAVAKFHAALAVGDTATVLALLSDDVAILESGGAEDKGHYRSGHMNGDIAFAKAVQSVRTVTSVRVSGNAAWITSTSVTQGESNGRPVNSAGAELVVLTRESGMWTIRAIHWSSRARRAAP